MTLRVLDLIEATMRDPFAGIGKPEPLKGLVVGRSSMGRLLAVSYTMRGDTTRIINARPANAEERQAYEQDASD